MFITDSSAHHPFVSQLLGDGKDAWRAVGLTAPNEWFLISYAVVTNKGRHTETALIASPVNELIAFLDREPDSVSIVAIQLVTPPYLNGSRHWKMESLTRIWKKSLDPLAHVYEVAGGNHYCTVSGKWNLAEYEFWRDFTEVA